MAIDETPEKPDSSLEAAVQGPSVRHRGRSRGSGSTKLPPGAARLDPLDYLLQVINDPKASDARRDRLALAALPYSCAKLHERAITQREKTQKAVATAIRGDDATNGWSRVLRARE